MRVNLASLFAGMPVLFLLIATAAQIGTGVSPQGSNTLRVPVDLVLVDVSVHDGKGWPVTDLEQQNFKIYEDKIEQPVSFFSEEESPVTWGFVLDRSGSMQGMIRRVHEAAVHVMDEGTNEDEMFIVTFSDRVELVSGLTSDRRKLRESIFGLDAQGHTALYDAVAQALDDMTSNRAGIARKFSS